MKAEDCYEGRWVIYRSHPDAEPEVGTVASPTKPGHLALVRYWDGGKVRATRPEDLTPGGEPKIVLGQVGEHEPGPKSAHRVDCPCVSCASDRHVCDEPAPVEEVCACGWDEHPHLASEHQPAPVDDPVCHCGENLSAHTSEHYFVELEQPAPDDRDTNRSANVNVGNPAPGHLEAAERFLDEEFDEPAPVETPGDRDALAEDIRVAAGRYPTLNTPTGVALDVLRSDWLAADRARVRAETLTEVEERIRALYVGGIDAANTRRFGTLTEAVAVVRDMREPAPNWLEKEFDRSRARRSQLPDNDPVSHEPAPARDLCWRGECRSGCAYEPNCSETAPEPAPVETPDGLLEMQRRVFGSTWDVLIPEEGRTVGWIIESVLEDVAADRARVRAEERERIAQAIESCASPNADTRYWLREAARIAREGAPE